MSVRTAGAAKAPLHTRKTLAAYLRISEDSVDRLVRVGDLKAIRVGGSIRFAPDDVAEFIDRNRAEPPAAEPSVGRARRPRR